MAKKKKGEIEVESNAVATAETTPSAAQSGERKKPDKNDYSYVIKNKRVRRDTKHSKIVKIVALVLAVLILAAGIIYGAITAVQVNSFKVFVDSSGNKILSLAENSNFDNASEVLEIKGPGTMDNTTLASGMNQVTNDAIQDKLLQIITGEGSQSGETDSFIASSFYLKNTTNQEQVYAEFLRIRNVTKNIDSAVRVMLVRDYEMFVYAKPQSDGTPEKVVPLDKNDFHTLVITEDADGKKQLDTVKDQVWISQPFVDTEYIFHNQNLTLQPGQIVKYSILVWIEGWDVDCTDDKLHGTISLDFGFQNYGK